jgi:aryl-phospho-beta-D-glucosidase BglC (GH1 family)
MGFAKKYDFNIIRVPIYWEAYVGNEDNFLAETELIAKEAQKHGIKVIYDNHHFFATSHWGADIRRAGIGFPSMLTDQYNPVGDGNTQTDNYGHAEVRAFWDDFFNNKVRQVPDAWSLQANYMKAVIERVDKHDNVMGYEILNEPHLWKKEHYIDLGEYHTAITKKLRQVTDKTIIFTRETTHGSYNRDPDYEKLILPLDPDKNVMYWPHTYQPPSRDAGQLQVKQFKRYQSEWAAMGYDVKIGIGEWGTQSNQITGLPVMDEVGGQALMDSFVSTWAKEDWPVTYWAFGCFSCGEGNKIIESDGSLTKYGKRYVKAIQTYYD